MLAAVLAMCFRLGLAPTLHSLSDDCELYESVERVRAGQGLRVKRLPQLQLLALLCCASE